MTLANYPGFAVERTDAIVLQGGGELMTRDQMSPYVWQDDDGNFGILVRGVPKAGADASDTGKIWYGRSSDGRSFVMEDEPVLAPDPQGLDAGGCEDPTLTILDGHWLVYYTGVDASHSCGQMLFAQGSGPHDLVKSGIALASSKTEGNTKEATVNRTADGSWRLFYEYAHDDASLIGLAIGSGVTGPWHEQPQPFAPRPDNWDSWHLSTGPLLTDDPDFPVMFYNGATHDAHWRIGWVVFNRDYSQVVARCSEPLITPPTIASGMTDIAFVATCVTPGLGLAAADAGSFWLYYSIEDRVLERAVCSRQTAPG